MLLKVVKEQILQRVRNSEHREIIRNYRLQIFRNKKKYNRRGRYNDRFEQQLTD
jgi:hypothetical protein